MDPNNAQPKQQTAPPADSEIAPDQNVVTPQTKKSKFKPALVFSIVFFFLTASVAAAYVGYTQVYNSPKRVLAAMVTNLSETNSYSYESSFNFASKASDKSAAIYLGNFNLDIMTSGKVDQKNPDSVKNQSKIEAYVNKLKVVEFESVSADKDNFFRINYLISFGYDLSSIKDTWVRLNLEELMSSYLGEVPQTLEPTQQQKNLQEEFVKKLTENPPFTISEKLKDEKVDDNNSFHYRVTVDKQTFGELINDVYKDSVIGQDYAMYQDFDAATLFDEFDFKDVELWVDKKRRVLRKIKVVMESNSETDSYSMDMSITLRDHNLEQQIELPGEFITTDEAVQRFSAAYAAGPIDNDEFTDLLQTFTIRDTQPESRGAIGDQFSSARDTQRQSDLLIITNAFYQYAVENNGNLPPNFPTEPTCIGAVLPCYDPGIVPVYLPEMPTDPQTGTAANTGYVVYLNQDGRIVVTAKGELTPTFSITK